MYAGMVGGVTSRGGHMGAGSLSLLLLRGEASCPDVRSQLVAHLRYELPSRCCCSLLPAGQRVKEWGNEQLQILLECLHASPVIFAPAVSL